MITSTPKPLTYRPSCKSRHLRVPFFVRLRYPFFYTYRRRTKKQSTRLGTYGYPFLYGYGTLFSTPTVGVQKSNPPDGEFDDRSYLQQRIMSFPFFYSNSNLSSVQVCSRSVCNVPVLTPDDPVYIFSTHVFPSVKDGAYNIYQGFFYNVSSRDFVIRSCNIENPRARTIIYRHESGDRQSSTSWQYNTRPAVLLVSEPTV